MSELLGEAVLELDVDQKPLVRGMAAAKAEVKRDVDQMQVTLDKLTAHYAKLGTAAQTSATEQAKASDEVADRYERTAKIAIVTAEAQEAAADRVTAALEREATAARAAGDAQAEASAKADLASVGQRRQGASSSTGSERALLDAADRIAAAMASNRDAPGSGTSREPAQPVVWGIRGPKGGGSLQNPITTVVEAGRYAPMGGYAAASDYGSASGNTGGAANVATTADLASLAERVTEMSRSMSGVSHLANAVGAANAPGGPGPGPAQVVHDPEGAMLLGEAVQSLKTLEKGIAQRMAVTPERIAAIAPQTESRPRTMRETPPVVVVEPSAPGRSVTVVPASSPARARYQQALGRQVGAQNAVNAARRAYNTASRPTADVTREEQVTLLAQREAATAELAAAKAETKAAQAQITAAGGGAGKGGGKPPVASGGGRGGGGGSRNIWTPFGGYRNEPDRGGSPFSAANLFKGDQGRGGAFGLPGFGSIGSLSGLGLEHWLLTGLGIGASATSAVGGAGLLGSASLTQGLIGGGSDALVSHETLKQVQTLVSLNDQLQQSQKTLSQSQDTFQGKLKQLGNPQLLAGYKALTDAQQKYGLNSKQASAAENALNQELTGTGSIFKGTDIASYWKDLQNAQNGAATAQANLTEQAKQYGPVAGAAEVAVAKTVSQVKSTFATDSEAARAESADMLDQIAHLGLDYVPLVTQAAQRNLGIINTGLKPLFSWLEGPQGMGIFHDLENAFAKNLPTSIHALDMGIEDFLRLMDAASSSTGGLTKAIDNWLTDKNRESVTQYDAEVSKLVGDLKLWEHFLGALGHDVGTLFKADAGTAPAIVRELTGELQKLGQWEQSAAGQDKLANIFAVHKQEILELLQALPKLVSGYGSFYLDVAPPLVKATTEIAKAFVAVADAIEQIPGGKDLVGLALVLGKLGLLGPSIKFLGGALGILTAAEEKNIAPSAADAIALTAEKDALGGTAAGGVGTSGVKAAETDVAEGAGLRGLGIGGAAKLGTKALGAGALGYLGTSVLANLLHVNGVGAAALKGAGAGAGIGATLAGAPGALLGAGIGAGVSAGLDEAAKLFSSHGPDYGAKFAKGFVAPFAATLTRSGGDSMAKAIDGAFNAAHAAQLAIAPHQVVSRAMTDSQTTHVETLGPSPEAVARAQAAWLHAGRMAADSFDAGLAKVQDPQTTQFIADFITELNKLPLKSRQAAASTMVQFTGQMVASGHLPKDAVEAVIQSLDDQFPSLTLTAAHTAQQTSAALVSGLKFQQAGNTLRTTLIGFQQEFGTLQHGAYRTTSGMVSNITSSYTDLRDNLYAISAGLANHIPGYTQKMKTGTLQAIQQLQTQSDQYFTQMATHAGAQVASMASQIQSGSATARDAASTNFQQLATNINAAMSAGVLSTGKGTQLIAAALNATLKAFGEKTLSIPQVAAATPGQLDSLASGSLAPSTLYGSGTVRPVSVHAGGGLVQIGRPGYPGRDTVPLNVGGHPIVVAPGEQVAVFNRHQLPIVNAALGHIGGLPGLFSSITTPNYMASGGFPPGFAGGGSLAQYDHTYPQHPTGTAGTQLSPTVIAQIAQAAGMPGLTFAQIAAHESTDMPGIVQSGEPPGSTGWGLWQITPGDPSLLNPIANASAARAKWQSQGQSAWAGDVPYVTDWNAPWTGQQLSGSIPGGGAGAAAAVTLTKILAPHITGGGTIGTIAQAALNLMAKGANKYEQAQAPTVAPSSGGRAPGSTAASYAGLPSGVGTYDGQPVDKWIIPVLQWAAAHGWPGSVLSGYRTDAQQLAAAASYAASKGETIAQIYPDGPLADNHVQPNYPGGAVDVSDAPQLASVLAGYPGHPSLIWGEPVIGDPDHFSATGHAQGGLVGPADAMRRMYERLNLPTDARHLPRGYAGGGTVPAPPGTAAAVLQAKMMAAANRWMGIPYVWGGGHGTAGDPSVGISGGPGYNGSTVGFDCSGFDSAMLHAAGFLNGSPLDTGGLASWGLPGPGKFITVADSITPDHTMLSFFGKFMEEDAGAMKAHWDSGWSMGFPIMRHPDESALNAKTNAAANGGKAAPKKQAHRSSPKHASAKGLTGPPDILGHVRQKKTRSPGPASTAGIDGPLPFDVSDLDVINQALSSVYGLVGGSSSGGGYGGLGVGSDGDAVSLSDMIDWYTNSLWVGPGYPPPNFSSWNSPGDFVISADAFGNPVTPFISPNIDGVSAELLKVIGWQGSIDGDLEQAEPLLDNLAPVIQKAIAGRQAQIAKIRARAEANIKRIREIQRLIAEIRKKIKRAQDRLQTAESNVTTAKGNIAQENSYYSPPYAKPSNDSERAQNAAALKKHNDILGGYQSTITTESAKVADEKTDIHAYRADIKSYQGEISPLEQENRVLTGSATSMGTAGELATLTGQLGSAAGTSGIGAAEGTSASAAGLFDLLSVTQGWAQQIGAPAPKGSGDLAIQQLQHETYVDAYKNLDPTAAGDLAAAAGASSSTSSQDSQLVSLLEQQNAQLAMEYAVSQAQYGALQSLSTAPLPGLASGGMLDFSSLGNLPPFGGFFETGGVVPGPVGAARTAIVHGGEVINPVGGTGPTIHHIIVQDGAVDPNKIRVIAAGEVQAQGRNAARVVRRKLPGRGGGYLVAGR